MVIHARTHRTKSLSLCALSVLCNPRSTCMLLVQTLSKIATLPVDVLTDRFLGFYVPQLQCDRERHHSGGLRKFRPSVVLSHTPTSHSARASTCLQMQTVKEHCNSKKACFFFFIAHLSILHSKIVVVV